MSPAMAFSVGAIFSAACLFLCLATGCVPIQVPPWLLRRQKSPGLYWAAIAILALAVPFWATLAILQTLRH